MHRSLPLRALSIFALAVAVLVVIGCSGNSGKNPADQLTSGSGRTAENGLTLTADPETITIDPDDPNTPTDPNNGDKQYGETQLKVVATDPAGAPQAGLAITFGTAAGTLASGGQPIMTDTEGVAQDTLRVYVDDPDSIQVSVADGTRVTTIVVTKVVVEPPVANAGPDQTVQCTGDHQATVHLDGSASTDPNSDITLYEWFENYGAANQVLLGTGVKLSVPLPLGSHTITLKVTDATAKSSTDDVIIEVVDTLPPVVAVSTTPSSLWPPNHRMVSVHANVRVDDCGPVTVSLVSVTSNEPDNGTGDGDTDNDVQGVEPGAADYDFQVRAERSGHGSGRVYTVVYKVVDSVGLETIATARVKVPHDQSGR